MSLIDQFLVGMLGGATASCLMAAGAFTAGAIDRARFEKRKRRQNRPGKTRA